MYNDANPCKMKPFTTPPPMVSRSPNKYKKPSDLGFPTFETFQAPNPMIGTLLHFSLHSIFSQVTQIMRSANNSPALGMAGMAGMASKIWSRGHQNSWQSSPCSLRQE